MFVPAVYRAPMRSRRADVDPAATLARARALNLVGFGDGPGVARRVERFAAVADGSFVWTRDPDGLFWLGRVDGAYFYDDDTRAAAVDLVHVRPCRWRVKPFLEPQVPSAVVATFGRGGRNFQQTHDPAVGAQTERLWDE